MLVKPGDTLAKDQPVLELETDKATIEVPSSVAGTVKEIKVKAGDKVKVGQAILSVDEAPAPRRRRVEAAAARPPATAEKAAKRTPTAPRTATGRRKPKKEHCRREPAAAKVRHAARRQARTQSTQPDKPA